MVTTQTPHLTYVIGHHDLWVPTFCMPTLCSLTQYNVLLLHYLCPVAGFTVCPSTWRWPPALLQHLPDEVRPEDHSKGCGLDRHSGWQAGQSDTLVSPGQVLGSGRPQGSSRHCFSTACASTMHRSHSQVMTERMFREDTYCASRCALVALCCLGYWCVCVVQDSAQVCNSSCHQSQGCHARTQVPTKSCVSSLYNSTL